MKKLIVPLFLICLLLVSCVSSDLRVYSSTKISSGKVFIQVDPSSSTVSGIGYGYSVGYMTFYSSAPETIKLGTIENNEIIKTSFIEKGYTIMTDAKDADYVVVIESTSNENRSKVSIGFYDIATSQLLFVCEGKYGLGWGIQDDLNKALLKALDMIPVYK